MDRLTRRLFLQGGALALATFGLPTIPGFARRALGEPLVPGAKRKTLIFLFLPGALDGLSVVTPYGETAIRELRPGLLHPDPGGPSKGGPLSEPLLALEPGLGLHPSLSAILPLYEQKSLAFVHAVGQPDPTRSHFDAQDFLELGTPGMKSTRDGWLSRALQLAKADGERTPLEAVAIGNHLPRSLQGGAKAFAFNNLGAVRLRPLAGGPGGVKGRSLARDTFEALYQGSSDAALAEPGKEAFEALSLLEAKLGKDFKLADGDYPKGAAGNSLKQLAALIKADVGLRVGCAALGGWDTHANQPGELSRRLGELGAALAAFWDDLGDHRDDVLLVAATEFGRTVKQNGALGTDHGHGSVALLLGGNVAGGKIYGKWPGLANDKLYEGRDLAVTTDLRAVLATAAEAQLGVGDRVRLFPGYEGPQLPFLRG